MPAMAKHWIDETTGIHTLVVRKLDDQQNQVGDDRTIELTADEANAVFGALVPSMRDTYGLTLDSKHGHPEEPQN